MREVLHRYNINDEKMRVRKKEIKTLGTKLIHLVSWCSEECAKLHDFVYKFSKNFRGTVCF